MGGADDPETQNSDAFVGPLEQPLSVLEEAEFDSDLIDHMDRCWKAHCENAERLNKKVNLVVSALALLFGLGLFKIEWTVDPKHVSRFSPEFWVTPFKALMILALVCFARGLWQGMRGVRRPWDDRKQPACELMRLPEDVIRFPPPNSRESRAQVFFRMDKAIKSLSDQNSEKAARISSCERWFTWGLAFVASGLIIYIAFTIPRIY